MTNDGAITASAEASSNSTASPTTILGSAGGRAGSNAEAIGTGVSGGAGDDSLLNRFVIDTFATATATTEASSWTLAGSPSDSAGLRAMARATGMEGGLGLDSIRNEDDAFVTLTAKLTATGGSEAIFGRSSSDTELTAAASGFGLAGGEEQDTIQNVGRVDVDATATLQAAKGTVSFAGSSSADAVLKASAASTGLDGGSGADTIANGGSVDVSATAASS